LVSFPLPSGSQVDAAEEHGELSGLKLDRGACGGLAGELKGAGLKTFVPDCEASIVPIQQLDAITSLVEEEEEVTGEEILFGEGLTDDSGESIKALSEIHGGRVEEDSHGGREA